MKTSFMFLAPGFEEMEAVNPLDVLRRGGVDIKTVSIGESRQVEGANGLTLEADMLMSELPGLDEIDFLVLPGGIPGAPNLRASRQLCNLLCEHASVGGHIAAICASPAVVLYTLGLLDGRKFSGYPGTEQDTDRAHYTPDGVTVDGNIITAKGPAFAIPFGLTILKTIQDHQTAQSVADGTLFTELVNCR